MMDPQETDQRLRGLYEQNSTPVDMVAFSAGLHERLSTLPAHKGWVSRLPWPLAARANERPDGLRQASASRRTSGLRIAVFASIAVVLVAAVAIGSFMAAQYLGHPHFVLAITDDNVVGAGSQTTATGTPSGQWERLPLSSEGGLVEALVIDPSNPSILYAGTKDGLFKSTDGARSWKQLSKIEGMVLLIVIDPAAPATVYALASQPERGLPPDCFGRTTEAPPGRT